MLKEEYAFINYETPNGKKKIQRLFNDGNGYDYLEMYENKKFIDKISCKHVECEYGRYKFEGNNYYKNKGKNSLF